MVAALRKSDLYSSLWSSADELRGGMDASQYKDYVLTLLFVKYVSDKAKADPSSLIEVPEGGSFDDLIAMKGKTDIGDLVNKAIVKLAEANDLIGVLTNADFDDGTKLGQGKELVDRLSNLIGIFQDIDFTGSHAEGDDLLGDAYEYLMRHFATESGKSKGQFYTPAEVSRVMAHLLKVPANAPRSTTVYDPTCGSGSLLIKVADASEHGLTIYGQENDVATWALARMNMILHGNETHDIRQGNTMSDPKFRHDGKLDTFDFIVANPPFSVKTWKNGIENNYGRFDGFDTPPDKSGDYAFLLHMVKSLKSTGRGVVVLPHGVLFRGNSEANIRKSLVKRGLIEAVIGLPPNLFYGTGIPACILILDKAGAANRKGIFMVDASKGYAKDGPKNRLRSRDMHRIVDAFTKSSDSARYSRFVTNEEIADPKNDYNLNIPRYIDSSEPYDSQDLSAHLYGGMPNSDLDELHEYWTTFPSMRSELFKPIREGYSELVLDKLQIVDTVIGSEEYSKFSASIASLITDWWLEYRENLDSINNTTVPNELVDKLAEDLLSRFRKISLIDEYAVYEQLMSYWDDSMHDDVTLIVGEGWVTANKPRPARAWKDKNGKTKYENADLQLGSGVNAQRWVMDLIPPQYIVSRFFPEVKADIESLNAELDVANAAILEFIDENAIEGGTLWDAVDDDGKITTTSVKNRLRAAYLENADDDEIEALEKLTKYYVEEASLKKKLKDIKSNLDKNTLVQYENLTETDIQSLVINDKWGKTIGSLIANEASVVGQYLVARLMTLAERYETTITVLDEEIAVLSERVVRHLEDMGITS